MPTKTPQTLKGFRDFLPSEARARQFLKHTIQTSFELFGFQPLETPTLEYASLLLGKYGTEADKLVYTFQDRGQRHIGLRYDQTVPTARVLATHSHLLSPSFRRYQIQNVFRAEKPQKGRYREFTQADIDIFGSTSPLSDAEVLACSYFVFSRLQLPQVTIKINHRQTLFDQLQPLAQASLPLHSIIQTIDKLDKLSQDQVIQELVHKGLSLDQAQQALTSLRQASPNPDLNAIIDQAHHLGIPRDNLIFTPTLARGLDYYTGMIFEITLPDQTASLAGGGRYDHLIKTLGGPDVPAVGMAIGFERTLEVLQQRQLIPPLPAVPQVLISPMDNSYLTQASTLAHRLRSAQVSTEIYLQPQDKLSKQIRYASKQGIPYLVIIGENEIKTGQLTLKDLAHRRQISLTPDQLVNHLSSHL